MISVVVPFFNERESVGELHRRLLAVLKKIGEPFEIIFVDDGSSDRTFEEIKKLSPVRGFRLRRNAGQTAAFGCGIAEAKGDVVVTSDGDLENQPEDIPLLLAKLDEGYDVVSGWRERRWQKRFMTRRIPSLAANRLISRVTGVYLHDHGCNLRAYRRHVFGGVAFNGEMHRMLAAYLGMRGARVGEIPVSWVPRQFGSSKYGIGRTFKVLLDVLALHFFKEYATRPMHFFGYVGFASIGAGMLTFFWAAYLRIFEGLHFNRTPLPILIAVFVVVGVQFILMGLLAEILLRSGREERQAREYDIGERIQN
ncbi:MAG: glycosyltransferase family 2 protein [Candidatus Sungbacteria bacterium]|uniref:Glycosyltransferase family 2 protein n=1 Tax=Candidatus Sungiibacteriota bacterium TaxID=2750080 RepID=A0A932QYW3_9BACT|nr:glycosyltransferase family 2 protein [Candidatus Sungbacteria bacterium]